ILLHSHRADLYVSGRNRQWPFQLQPGARQFGFLSAPDLPAVSQSAGWVCDHEYFLRADGESETIFDYRDLLVPRGLQDPESATSQLELGERNGTPVRHRRLLHVCTWSQPDPCA